MRRLLLVLALAVLVAACAGGEPVAGPEPETPASSPSAPEAPATAAPAPADGPSGAGGTAPFEGTVATVDGGALAGADFVRRDVALWFWAPW